MFKSLFCKHDMKVIFEYTSESPAEQISRLTELLERPKNVESLLKMTQKEQIVIVCCKECGKMKTVKTKFNQG
ncbi:hypothetical protein [Aeromonas phage AS-yj]|uniref:Uncharacterized protein n=5 Tax=Ceceduovirus TaxID=2842588 RepID=A0A291LCX0_9CAUD|nr:hypothetical protein HWB28_gp201 [Aeromonas phage AS-zj]YP_009834725.1 hypothetical protein HWB29_gp023 [Aeromonas phage AS-sw]ATI17236.1 hypothetical protein [Aeromonas phage AS-szw]ATI17862.1 hypothetical protein [Aeromonas phage AS-yj]QAX97679.1 hypothetical protein ASswx1_33 [Aeromonas phage Asswx_1]QAX98876.1 hypothetical protein assk_78 [Aeromonas phage Assk]UKM62713.1 hypothetical protein P19_0225 [Aeromonas phage P19]